MEALPTVVVLLALLGAFVFWVWALVDALRVPDEHLYRTGTKVVWVLVIGLTQFVGAVIYVAVGRPSPAAASGR